MPENFEIQATHNLSYIPKAKVVNGLTYVVWRRIDL